MKPSYFIIQVNSLFKNQLKSYFKILKYVLMMEVRMGKKPIQSPDDAIKILQGRTFDLQPVRKQFGVIQNRRHLI